MTNYTIQSGDTLSKIAKAHGVSVSELAKQNGITDIDKIEVGQQLSIGQTTEMAEKTQSEPSVGFDNFEKQIPENEDKFAPLGYAAGGALAYGMLDKATPHIVKGTKKGYTAVKTGTEQAYRKMKVVAKHNGKVIRNVVAEKAKHMKKSAELHYAFGKDAVQKGAQKVATKTKTTAQNVASKTKTTAQKVVTKTKTVAGQAAHKAKVSGRLTRYIANTKVAPKLIKGAGRLAAPIAIGVGVGEVKAAYEKGGTKAAAKQAVKVGSGLACGWAGAKVGAAVGSVAGPIGTAVGSIVGGICGYLWGEKLFS